MSNKTLKTADDLIEAGLAPAEARADLHAVAQRYAVSITPHLSALIAAAPEGPLARQFLPHADELHAAPEERADPIGDGAWSPVKGIVHRYPDRALLKVVSACPVYCRFCFRREMVGPQGAEETLGAGELDAALDYIRTRKEIWEAIVTGGDPFILSARRAADLSRRLGEIEHVRVVRWHTRAPIGDPARVTDAFVRALKIPGRAVYVAVHVNHADELTPEASAACARLADAGIPLLAQTVLLKGVNDDPDTLEALMRALVERRIKPYYLHHADLAPGTAHFRTTLEEGQALARALRDRASGLCQPAYVLDIPGGVSKALAAPSDVEFGEDGPRVRGRDGAWRVYPASQDR